MSNTTFYLVEKQPPLAWVYLNRPEKKNAMGPKAWTEPVQIFAELDGGPATLMHKAKELAQEIADNSPLAVQASKDVLNFCLGKSIDDGLKYVASVSANIIPSEDLLEAINAFREKRKPNFTGK